MIQGLAAITLTLIASIGFVQIGKMIEENNETKYQEKIRAEQRKHYKEMTR